VVNNLNNKYEHMLNKEASKYVYNPHDEPVVHGIISSVKQ